MFERITFDPQGLPDLTREDVTEALEYTAWLAQEGVHAG